MDPAGAFAGVPYLMKDLGPTLKGRLQEMGSLLMRGDRATADSRLAGRIRQAGLNVIGRTTTPEFGCCSAAENPAVYVTRNPWDTGYTTNGSSAGTGAMVAAGVLPISHATDGGGSIRIPAGACGNIGLKVSRGVFSIAPAASDLTGLVSHPGLPDPHRARHRAVRGQLPRRRARRIHALLVAGRSPTPTSSGATPGGCASRCRTNGATTAPRRIWSPNWRRPGASSRGLGHQVDWALPAVDFRAAFAAQTDCYIGNFAETVGNLIAARGLDQPPADLVEPINIRIWEEGRRFSFTDRARMQAVFNTTSRGFGAFFEEWDIILTPITALPTPPIGTTEYLTISDNPSVRDWFGNLWRNFAYTPLANLCGIPAISLPMGRQESGLPLGIQAQARQANDGLLLQLAAQIERALGGEWNEGRRPGVHVTG